jgi:hypothetical protein
MTKKPKKTLAQAKKMATTPTYATTGPVAARVEERLRLYMQDMPQELHAILASLLPFDDVIQGGCCGDDAAKFLHHPPAGRVPFFMVETADPQSSMSQYQFVVTASGVTGQLLMYDGKGNAECDLPFEMSLGGLYNFLRQLPRHANAFAIG